MARYQGHLRGGAASMRCGRCDAEQPRRKGKRRVTNWFCPACSKHYEDRAAALLRIAGISPKRARSDKRVRRVERGAVALQLIAEGCPIARAAKLVGIDRTTVHYHQNRRRIEGSDE